MKGNSYKDLLFNLVRREVAGRYKQSILGYFWVVLNPLFQMIVMTVVFSRIMRISIPGVPYFLFLYVGLLPWTFFTSALTSAMGNLVGMGSLIKKVYFPRELIVLATMIAKIVDLFLASLIFVFFMIVFRQPSNIWLDLLIVPLIFAIQFLFTFGVALLISAVNLFYRDVQYLMGLILMLWFYLTPVIYPMEMVPSGLRFLFSLNPMSVLINAYRHTVLGAQMPDLLHLLVAFLVSLVAFLIGWGVFRKLEGRFADVV